MRFITATNMLGAFTALLALTSATTTATSPATAPTSDPDLPFPVGVAKWTGLSKGTNITLTGMTAHEIQAHLKSLDPDWKPVSKRVAEAGIKEARTQSGFPNCCPIRGWNWHLPSNADVAGAAIAIQTLGGTWSVLPRNCLNVYAMNGVGIWACNDWPNIPLDLAGQQIGIYAMTLNLQCATSYGCGQLFDTDNWNTIVHSL